MIRLAITNPKTGRTCNLRAWRVDPKAITAKCREGVFKTAKDISWALLNDDESIQDMQDTEYGDSSRNNSALRMFESALDWTLGLAVLNYIRAFTTQKKFPKSFHVGYNTSGDVFVVGASGNVYPM